MFDKFSKFLMKLAESIHDDWLILGALIAAVVILAIGFLMTIFMTRKLSNPCNVFQVLRSRARRNVLLIIAFVFAILVFSIYEGAIYLTIPALVLLWAFICEALFECIDDRNRKKNAMKICFCSDCEECPDCKVEQRKVIAKTTKPTEKTLKPEVKETKEIKETKGEPQAMKKEDQAEETHRQDFEEKRKELATLARQVEAARFASISEVKKVSSRAPSRDLGSAAPKPAPKPVVVKPAPVAKIEEAKKIDIAEKTTSVKTTTATMVATTRMTKSEHVTKSETTATRFDSLQAKLDVLKKDTATAKARTEKQGKYDEKEVRGALADLFKSMNARRGEE